MKKTVKIFSILSVIAVILTMSLVGCDLFKTPWERREVDKGFYYYWNDGGAVILGITSEIDYPNNDELVIPEKLGGYTVKYIGEAYCPAVGCETECYGINAAGIKRIIVNHPITVYGFGFTAFNGDLIINSPVEYFVFESICNCKSIQINVNINLFDILREYESYIYDKLNDYGFYEIKYEAVGGQQKTFITALKIGKLLPEPEEPTKEGHTFEGWFTNDKYETQWNFEEDLVTENMTLYAKWIEN